MARRNGAGGKTVAATAHGTAGASAQRELERRRARERDQMRQRWGLWVAITLIAPVVAFVGVRAGAPVLWEMFGESMRSTDGLEELAWEPLPAETLNLLATVAALAAFITVGKALWGRRRTTEVWGVGADGERRTAADLERLPAGHHVLHDVRMPGSRANVDHLVIGPTGVFTVETKHRKAKVVIRRSGVTAGGRTMAPAVDQARRQAEAISSLLGVPVRPIVAVQGAGLEVQGWRTSPTVGGVRFCSGARLAKVITAGPRTLSDDEVSQLFARANASLTPA